MLSITSNRAHPLAGPVRRPTTPTVARSLAALLVAAVVSTVAAGCGSSSSPPAAAPSSTGGAGTSTSGTAGGGSTTVAPTPGTGSTPGSAPAAPGTSVPIATSDEAKGLVITLADLGGTWVEFPGDDFAAQPIVVKSGECAKDELRQATSGWTGAMLQRGTDKVFSQTAAAVFASPEAAEAYVKALDSPAAIECLRVHYEEQAKRATPDATYEATRETAPPVGQGGLEAQTRFQLREPVDGQVQNVDGSITRFVYRQGPVVMTETLQLLNLGSAADTLGPAIGDDIQRGMSAVYGRLPR